MTPSPFVRYTARYPGVSKLMHLRPSKPWLTCLSHPAVYSSTQPLPLPSIHQPHHTHLSLSITLHTHSSHFCRSLSRLFAIPPILRPFALPQLLPPSLPTRPHLSSCLQPLVSPLTTEATHVPPCTQHFIHSHLSHPTQLLSSIIHPFHQPAVPSTTLTTNHHCHLCQQTPLPPSSPLPATRKMSGVDEITSFLSSTLPCHHPC